MPNNRNLQFTNYNLVSFYFKFGYSGYPAIIIVSRGKNVFLNIIIYLYIKNRYRNHLQNT